MALFGREVLHPMLKVHPTRTLRFELSSLALTQFHLSEELVILFSCLNNLPFVLSPPMSLFLPSMDFWELLGHCLKWFELLEESQGKNQKLAH